MCRLTVLFLLWQPLLCVAQECVNDLPKLTEPAWNVDIQDYTDLIGSGSAVGCNAQRALKEFVLLVDTTPEPDTARYSYTCACMESAAEDSKVTEFNNGERVLPERSFTLLDRHEVSCLPEGVLAGFELESQPANASFQIRYSFTCRSFQSGFEGKCNSALTTPTVFADDYTELQNHPVGCPSGQHIGSFQLKTPQSSQIQYTYSCCEAVPVETTPSTPLDTLEIVGIAVGSVLGVAGIVASCVKREDFTKLLTGSAGVEAAESTKVVQA